MSRPQVESVGNGRSGIVYYREGENEHAFDWEIGGSGSVVAIIYVPTPEEWDTQIPWAAGRRTEVLQVFGAELCRQQCPTCTVEILDHWVHLHESRQPAPTVLERIRRVFGVDR
jgi:hypothetical protein